MHFPRILPNGLFENSDASKELKGQLPFCLAGFNCPWEQVIHLGERFTYKQAQRLEADKGSPYFYFLRAGIIQTWHEEEDGERLLHLFMREGMLFMDMLVLSGLYKDNYAVFMEDSQIVRFNRDTLFTQEFCHKYPHLLLNLASSLARKGMILSEFRNSGGKFEIINQVARILYTMAVDRNTLNSCLTQEAISGILRIHRSSVARVIKRLKELGIIDRATKSGIVILDKDRLRLYALGING